MDLDSWFLPPGSQHSALSSQHSALSSQLSSNHKVHIDFLWEHKENRRKSPRPYLDSFLFHLYSFLFLPNFLLFTFYLALDSWLLALCIQLSALSSQLTTKFTKTFPRNTTKAVENLCGRVIPQGSLPPTAEAFCLGSWS